MPESLPDRHQLQVCPIQVLPHQIDTSHTISLQEFVSDYILEVCGLDSVLAVGQSLFIPMLSHADPHNQDLSVAARQDATASATATRVSQDPSASIAVISASQEVAALTVAICASQDALASATAMSASQDPCTVAASSASQDASASATAISASERIPLLIKHYCFLHGHLLSEASDDKSDEGLFEDPNCEICSVDGGSEDSLPELTSNSYPPLSEVFEGMSAGSHRYIASICKYFSPRFKEDYCRLFCWMSTPTFTDVPGSSASSASFMQEVSDERPLDDISDAPSA